MHRMFLSVALVQAPWIRMSNRLLVFSIFLGISHNQLCAGRATSLKCQHTLNSYYIAAQIEMFWKQFVVLWGDVLGWVFFVPQLTVLTWDYWLYHKAVSVAFCAQLQIFCIPSCQRLVKRLWDRVLKYIKLGTHHTNSDAV